ncbi:MAG: hypothetical protein KKG76_01730 [Euryarchaeota archaeon]|nr:hypothetical protein [Euryarchaeota archaeon]MBU4139859.1 hypothetical protein [Euryarchaeota archaeon]
MAENKILSYFPVLAFGIGAVIQSLGIMSESNIGAGMTGYISIIALGILLLASYFLYLK